MKKIIFSLIIVITVIICLYVRTTKQNTVEINGKELTLKYSTCGLKQDVCMNEYYLKDEYDNNWTELFTVVYSPTANDPQKVAETMLYSAMTQLQYMVGSNLFNSKNDNSKLVEYGIMFYTEKREPAIEQNTAKVMLYPYGNGVIVQQYAKRYIFDKNKSEAEIKKDLREYNDTYLKVMAKLPARKVYMKPLQKW